MMEILQEYELDGILYNKVKAGNFVVTVSEFSEVTRIDHIEDGNLAPSILPDEFIEECLKYAPWRA